jgi:hypothetical protein
MPLLPLSSCGDNGRSFGTVNVSEDDEPDIIVIIHVSGKIQDWKGAVEVAGSVGERSMVNSCRR